MNRDREEWLNNVRAVVWPWIGQLGGVVFWLISPWLFFGALISITAFMYVKLERIRRETRLEQQRRLDELYVRHQVNHDGSLDDDKEGKP